VAPHRQGREREGAGRGGSECIGPWQCGGGCRRGKHEWGSRALGAGAAAGAAHRAPRLGARGPAHAPVRGPGPLLTAQGNRSVVNSACIPKHIPRMRLLIVQGALQRAGQVHVWRVRHVLAVTQVMQLQQAKKRAQLEMPLSMRAGAARADVARARAQWQHYMSAAPRYPARLYSGRGIVILAGGATYLVPAWVNVRMLRSTGASPAGPYGNQEQGLFASRRLQAGHPPQGCPRVCPAAATCCSAPVAEHSNPCWWQPVAARKGPGTLRARCRHGPPLTAAHTPADPLQPGMCMCRPL